MYPKYLYRSLKPNQVKTIIQSEEHSDTNSALPNFNFYEEFFKLREGEDYISFIANHPDCYTNKCNFCRIANAFKVVADKLNIRNKSGLYEIKPEELIIELSGYGKRQILDFVDKNHPHWGMLMKHKNKEDRDIIFSTLYYGNCVHHPYKEYIES